MSSPTPRCPPDLRFIKAIHLLQEKWVLFIIYGLLDGPLGFNEVGRRARGVNTTTLAQRMEMLEREGIVTKEIITTIPPKTSYTLTETGLALGNVLDEIQRWGVRYLPVEELPCCESEPCSEDSEQVQ